MLFGSLRSRLLILLVTTVFLATALAAIFGVFALRHEAVQRFDEMLEYEAYELSTFARTVLRDAYDGKTPEKVWGSEAGQKILSESLEHSIRLLDAELYSLIASGPLKTAPKLEVHTTKTFSNFVEDDGTQIHVFTFAVDDLGYVQVADGFSTFDDILSSNVLIAGWGIGLATLLSMLIGWWWAGNILQPVRLITKTAATLSLESLHKRIQYRGTAGGELQELAQTFDHMLDRLAASARKLRQFTSDASHELRTPITALRLSIDVALQEGTKKSCTTALRHAKTELTQLSTLIERLLLLARADSNAMQADMDTLDLKTILQRIEHTLAPLVKDKNIKLEIPKSSATVRADAELLQHALINIIQNAIQHTPRGTKVQISLRTNKKQIELRVRDAGPGISADDQKKIFDRFYRRDSSRTGSSTGLGLAIAAEIIHAHHGHIRVQSDIGKGATFIVSLPQS